MEAQLVAKWRFKEETKRNPSSRGDSMSVEFFGELRGLLQTSGPIAAIERLCAHLRLIGDYHSLFYALLLKKRFELGVSPIPTGPVQELPEAAKGPYEEAITEG